MRLTTFGEKIPYPLFLLEWLLELPAAAQGIEGRRLCRHLLSIPLPRGPFPWSPGRIRLEF